MANLGHAGQMPGPELAQKIALYSGARLGASGGGSHSPSADLPEDPGNVAAALHAAGSLQRGGESSGEGSGNEGAEKQEQQGDQEQQPEQEKPRTRNEEFSSGTNQDPEPSSAPKMNSQAPDLFNRQQFTSGESMFKGGAAREAAIADWGTSDNCY